MGKEDQHVEKASYVVVPRVLVFLFKEDELLLIKGSSKKRIWANLYNAIGGHVEQGESVLETAKRELVEETGLKNHKLTLCGTVMVDVENNIGVCIYVFYGEYEGGEITKSLEGNIEWKKIKDLKSIPVVEDLQVLVKEIIKRKNRMVPFFAKSFYDTDNDLKIVITS
jgi:8-oxo-dGTP diphosphatase